MAPVFGRRSVQPHVPGTEQVRPAPAPSGRGLLKALIVFAFFFVLAAQTYTGFLYQIFGGIRPKAAVVLDGLIDFLLVSRIGVTASSALLLALAIGLAILVYVREPRPRG